MAARQEDRENARADGGHNPHLSAFRWQARPLGLFLRASIPCAWSILSAFLPS